MTKTEFSAELREIARLLREHAFLRYSPSGQREYDEKLATADGLFASAVARASGVPVPSPYPDVTIEALTSGRVDAAVRAPRQVAARLAARAKAAGRSGGPEARRLEADAEAWGRAAAAIAKLPR